MWRFRGLKKESDYVYRLYLSRASCKNSPSEIDVVLGKICICLHFL